MAETKTLRVTLDIQVAALSGDELEQASYGLDEVVKEDEAQAELDEADAGELADLVAGMFQEDAIRSTFAGSNMFLTFEESPEVINAEWVDENS